MYNSSEMLFTNVRPESRIGKIVQFPLTRILIVLVFLIPVSLFGYLFGLESFGHIRDPFYSTIRYGRDLFFLVLFMLMYGLYTRIAERREPYELSFKKAHLELGAGFLLSFCLVGFMVLLLALPGFYKIVNINPVKNLTDSFMLQMMVGFTEELLFRLILFKLVEEFAGSWIAIAVQGLIFGFAHIGNPNASVWTTVGLVVSDTFLFGGAFMLTRRIWFIMGMHWSWNFFQAGVFGMPNSGTTRPGWITSSVNGPVWLTGGAWGIEASYVAVFILFILGLFIFTKSVRNGQLVRPSWKRKSMS